ncbi:MAG TPA: RNA polymerase sigma factor [Acidimicrobiales bacterium]|nr:RNA polymerase sigma factor [Acidimicrobiales bacterium]
MPDQPLAEADLDRLARTAAAGDKEALDALLAAVHDRVQRQCRRALPNVADAEDAAQDVLLLVSRRIGTFEGRSRFTTWLFRLTGNALLDTYRRLKRQVGTSGVADELVASRERTSVLAGTRVDLLEAMERVPALYAEPVMLRDVCQLDYHEIAAVLAVPVGTVRRRAHEGRRQLQRLLGEHYS